MDKAFLQELEERAKNRKPEDDIGCRAHVPCHVKPGPFPNERRVLIDHRTEKPWFGFVTTDNLNQKVEKGDDLVRAIIIAADEHTITVRVNGESVGDSCVVLKR